MFKITYLITCYSGEDLDEKIRWICLEQSVELPEDVVPLEILNSVVGKVEDVEQVSENKYRVQIIWPIANVGDSPTQFLNVLYGNISLKRGIKIEHVDWQGLTKILKGPHFGIHGIREESQLHNRPLSCAVLKPMGLTAKELADQAFELAMGGIDIIKDDHGLANQEYAPFEERVSAVSEAVQKARFKHNKRALYFPNITTSGSKIYDNFESAYDWQVDGVMVLPHLCGFEVMHELAQQEFELPIIAHPAFSGTLVTDPDHGFTPAFLYGELYRAFGADFTVYPNTGGRFSFTPEECAEINEASRTIASPYKTIFPMPGGGMKRETIRHWISEYGNDTVFLIGASLMQHPDGIRKAAAELTETLEAAAFRL